MLNHAPQWRKLRRCKKYSVQVSLYTLHWHDFGPQLCKTTFILWFYQQIRRKIKHPFHPRERQTITIHTRVPKRQQILTRARQSKVLCSNLCWRIACILHFKTILECCVERVLYHDRRLSFVTTYMKWRLAKKQPNVHLLYPFFQTSWLGKMQTDGWTMRHKKENWEGGKNYLVQVSHHT